MRVVFLCNDIGRRDRTVEKILALLSGGAKEEQQPWGKHRILLKRAEFGRHKCR